MIADREKHEAEVRPWRICGFQKLLVGIESWLLNLGSPPRQVLPFTAFERIYPPVNNAALEEKYEKLFSIIDDSWRKVRAVRIPAAPPGRMAWARPDGRDPLPQVSTQHRARDAIDRAAEAARSGAPALNAWTDSGALLP